MKLIQLNLCCCKVIFIDVMPYENLKNEAKYPLKWPLLGFSTVLAGKGAADVLVTTMKVAAGMPHASFAETFAGVPVVAIDAACIAAGISLGAWTWKSMQ
eukprot:g21882.t1